MLQQLRLWTQQNPGARLPVVKYTGVDEPQVPFTSTPCGFHIQPCPRSCTLQKLFRAGEQVLV